MREFLQGLHGHLEFGRWIFLSPLSYLFLYSFLSLTMGEKGSKRKVRAEKQDRRGGYLMSKRENYLPRTRESKNDEEMREKRMHEGEEKRGEEKKWNFRVRERIGEVQCVAENE